MKSYEKIIYLLVIASSVPFLLFFTRVDLVNNDYIYALANISGYIGGVLLLWEFVLGNRTITRVINPDYTQNIRLHTFLGVYGAIFIMLHPILEMLSYLQNLLFIFIPSFASSIDLYYTLGRVAFLLFLVIWITSALVREKITYRPWLYIHYITYPLMALVFLHAIKTGTFFNSFELVRLYWYALTGVFIFVLFIRCLEIFNVIKNRYTVTENYLATDNIWVIRLRPASTFNMPKVGQFFYIKTSFIGESHPFSVTEFNGKTGELEFAYETIGRFTYKLSKVAKDSRVYLDGPYGAFTHEAHINKSPKVIIAGGIGITPFVELIKNFSDDKTYLFYCNRYLKNALYRERFKEILGDRYFDVISREEITGDAHVLNGRLDMTKVITNVPGEILKDAYIFVCGSPVFVDAMVEMLEQSNQIRSEQIKIEDLGF